jgi:hypothetical protein
LFGSLFPEFLFPLVAVILSIILIYRWRWPGIIVLLLSLLFLFNARPLRTSRFTPYDGNQGIAPYQDLIDYAASKGVLTFWAHPESNYSTKGTKLGPITLKTEKYQEDLQIARGYTGFAAIYGDNTTMEKPGHEWDRILLDYCKGSRDRPVWAIAGADFHGDNRSDRLDTYLTVAWARNLSRRSLLDALQNGRCYAILQARGKGLRLDRFQLQEPSGELVWSGDTLVSSGNPMLIIDLSFSERQHVPVTLRVIRNGKIWYEFEGETPLKASLRDDALQQGRSYYRLEVIGKGPFRLLSNPVFVVKH